MFFNGRNHFVSAGNSSYNLKGGISGKGIANPVDKKGMVVSYYNPFGWNHRVKS